MGSFGAKYVLFELKKYKGVIFLDIEEWCRIWRKIDWLLGKWHEEFCKLSPEHSKVSKLEVWKDAFVQSRKCISFKFTVELHVSWQWRMIQKLKRNWLFILKLTWTSQNLTWAVEKSKNLFFLIGSLWPKYILLELQKHRRVIFHDTEELCKFWRKTDQWFEKRHEKFCKFSP